MLGLKYIEGAIPGKNNKRKQSLAVITEEGKKSRRNMKQTGKLVNSRTNGRWGTTGSLMTTKKVS